MYQQNMFFSLLYFRGGDGRESSTMAYIHTTYHIISFFIFYPQFHHSPSHRAAPFYVGWSGSGGGGCSNASNAPYAPSADIKIYNT